MTDTTTATPVGPVDGTEVPRFAGSATFARLPRIDEVGAFDVAVLGAPFDGGVSFRPGARFGPSAIRQASRHLRPAYNPAQDVAPYAVLQAVDAGDVPCNPFDIDHSLQQIDDGVSELLAAGGRPLLLGGDHTIALGGLRAVARKHGPVALIHFDAHLDTWNSYFGADRTHGTVFRRAHEEGLLVQDASSHVGIRGPLYSAQDLLDDAALGSRSCARRTSTASGWRRSSTACGGGPMTRLCTSRLTSTCWTLRSRPARAPRRWGPDVA